MAKYKYKIKGKLRAHGAIIGIQRTCNAKSMRGAMLSFCHYVDKINPGPADDITAMSLQISRSKENV